MVRTGSFSFPGGYGTGTPRRKPGGGIAGGRGCDVRRLNGGARGWAGLKVASMLAGSTYECEKSLKFSD